MLQKLVVFNFVCAFVLLAND